MRENRKSVHTEYFISELLFNTCFEVLNNKALVTTALGEDSTPVRGRLRISATPAR